MSNWFEDNPCKSIILYTILIVGATWGATRFILQDNRIELLRSELDVQKALSEQYKTKAEFLSKDLENVRAENTEYRAWLSQSKVAFPAIMPRLTELKTYIAALEGQVAQLSKNTAAYTPVVKNARRGIPIVDEQTGLQIDVKEVTIDRRASIIVKFPDRDTKSYLSVKRGEQFKFKHGPASYTLSVVEVYYLADSIEFSVLQEKSQ